jgi:hypothetical protein
VFLVWAENSPDLGADGRLVLLRGTSAIRSRTDRETVAGAITGVRYQQWTRAESRKQISTISPLFEVGPSQRFRRECENCSEPGPVPAEVIGFFGVVESGKRAIGPPQAEICSWPFICYYVGSPTGSSFGRTTNVVTDGRRTARAPKGLS